MKGIAPAFYDKVNEAYLHAVSDIKEKVAKLLEKENVLDEIIDKVRELNTDDIDRKHTGTLQEYMQTEYVERIIDSVDSFSIEDMANMAENLISITSLQRHFSSSDETVGGPIDVAVITKSGGFRWIKCKNIINRGEQNYA